MIVTRCTHCELGQLPAAQIYWLEFKNSKLACQIIISVLYCGSTAFKSWPAALLIGQLGHAQCWGSNNCLIISASLACLAEEQETNWLQQQQQVEQTTNQ